MKRQCSFHFGSSLIHSLFFSLRLFCGNGSSHVMRTMGCGKTHMARNGGPQPTTKEDPRPAKSHMRDLKVDLSFPNDCCLSQHTDCNLTRDSEQTNKQTNHNISHFQFPCRRNCELINVCCFKLLSLEVLCYTAYITNTVLTSAMCN